MTIDASDSNGNPLDQNLALPGSRSTDSPFGASATLGGSPNDDLASAIFVAPRVGSSSISGQAAVPEPASIMLLVMGALALVGATFGRRSMRPEVRDRLIRLQCGR